MRSLDEISRPPRALRGKPVCYVWRSKEVPARYHIARNWPSTCGTGLIFMQDMVGGEGVPPALVAPALSRGPYPRNVIGGEGVDQGAPSPGRGVWVPAFAGTTPRLSRK